MVIRVMEKEIKFLRCFINKHFVDIDYITNCNYERNII